MNDGQKLSSSRVTVPDSIEDAYEFAYDKGWTDGLPIIPPTPERVEKMLASVKRDPGEVVAKVQPALGEATLEKIAINAVMAGCLPGYMPIIIAAVQAMTEPVFNLDGIQCTTNPVAPLAIINGPIVKELDINYGYGALGPGRRANATIGRAIRFILLNIGGAVPGQVSKATLGQPGRYTFCLAENEELNPWQPLHVERGFDRNTSTVTVVGVTCLVNTMPLHSKEAIDQLITLANSMTVAGSNNYVLGGGAEVLVALAPTVARYLVRGGYSKEAVKKYFFENTRLPISHLGKEIQEYVRKDGRLIDGLVNLVPTPEDFMIIVAGGDTGSHSVFAPTFGLTRAVTKPILA